MTNKEVAEFLRQNDNFLIINHRRPDGDAVGCAAALCRGLRAMGKTAYVWKNPQTIEKHSSYVEGLEIEEEPENACIITVDMATEGLLPLNGEAFSGRVRLCIDHHPSNNFYAQDTDVHPECAACGEIILEILEDLLDAPSKEMAEALYLAISTDTGCFQYSNVTAATLHAAARLKELGADTFPINKEMFGTKTIGRLRLEAALTDSAEFYADGLVCVCEITNAMLDSMGLSEDDIDDISSFPRSILGVEVGVMLRDLREGGAKISLRTGEDYNASAMCAGLGGGGHHAAAGASVSGTIEDAKKAILAEIEKSGVKL